MNKLTVGVTGEKGTLGRIACQKLSQKGIKVHPFGGDVCSDHDIDSWFKAEEMDAIIHFAAIVPTRDVEDNPTLANEVNVEATRKIIEKLIKNQKKPWFFYASSSHVYASSSSPIKESDPTIPMNLYGQTKLAAEHELMRLEKKFIGTICIGRIFSFYHETQDSNFLYPSIKKRLLNHDPNLPFELFGADNERDFLNAEEVVNKIMNLFDFRVQGTINIGSGKSTRVEDFVREVFNIPTLKIKNINEGERNMLVADITKYEQIIAKELKLA